MFTIVSFPYPGADGGELTGQKMCPRCPQTHTIFASPAFWHSRVGVESH